MTSLIYFILALGIIVLVHELGHLIVAKRNGVYCHEFSIGMGPKIKTIKTDASGTVYNIRAIPLGGYVMMAGEENDNVNDKDIPKDQLLNNKNPWQRFKILIAGSSMNVILTFVLLVLMTFFAGIPSNSNTVKVVPNENVAKVINQSEIVITKVNGNVTSDYESIFKAISDSSEKEVTLTLENNEEIVVSKNIENKIGIAQTTDKYRLFKSIYSGFISTIALFGIMIETLMALFTAKVGVNELSGPVGIYQASSQILTIGIGAAVYWIAYLSINIGVMNLLPIPALDGGRIIFVIYEVITRKKVNKKIENNLIIFSFLLLMGLFIYVTFNDIFKIFN